LRQHARRRGVALRAWRSTAARRARATLAASSKAAMSCAVKQALAAQRKVLESQRGDSIESVTAALRSTYDAQLAALRVDLAAALALATQLREEKVCERASEKNAFSAALVEALGEQRALLEGERVAALELQEQRVRAEFDEVRCNFFCLLPFFCLLILSVVCSLLIAHILFFCSRQELRALHALINDLGLSAQSAAMARGEPRAVPKLSRYGKFSTTATVAAAAGKFSSSSSGSSSSSSSSVRLRASTARNAAIDGSPLGSSWRKP
jgi:hypothetical protein